MGIFSTSSPFDQDVEKATSENNTSEEWGLILEICDRAGASPQAAKDCLRAVLRRLAHPDPHVQVHACTLLDACVSNCGRTFHLEVASRDFETEFRRLVSRAQPPVAQRLRALLRKWAEGEFRSDPQLDLIPSLYAKMRQENSEPDAPRRRPSSPNGSAAQREQEELARAIALSLRESGPPAAAAAAAPSPAPATSSGPASASSTLYPRVDSAAEVPPARKVRALYDFEAAEDNELTFLAGEIVHVTDSSDPNWWKGYNDRGEGLFPANFVSADLGEPLPAAQSQNESRGAGGGKTVQFAADVGGAVAEDEPVEIDEAAMDAALALLHEADPECAGDAADEARLAAMESRVYRMGPLIDAALERADRRHARLTQLSAELVDALNLYHSLMRAPLYGPAPPAPPAPPAQLHGYFPHPPPPRC